MQSRQRHTRAPSHHCQQYGHSAGKSVNKSGVMCYSSGLFAAALNKLNLIPSVQPMSNFLFTSESVSEGHPDKIADQISDAVLDAILAQDKNGRVAAETLIHTGLVVLAGQITTSARVDYAKVARQIIKRIGYDDSEIGFDYKSCARHGVLRPAVPRHRAGRGRRQGPRPRAGRGRPGPDVRLCLRRNAAADADADLLRAPADGAPCRAAPRRPAAVATARRQVAGLGALRRRQAAPHRHGGDLDPAPRGHRPQAADRKR